MAKEKAASEVTDKRNERQTSKPIQASARPTKHVHDMLIWKVHCQLGMCSVHSIYSSLLLCIRATISYISYSCMHDDLNCLSKL